MAEKLGVYHPRSPRYILYPNENKMLRFRSPSSRPESTGTEVVNLSKTGLAFIYTGESPPKVGELITIQFEVPNRDPMACYAEVVRCDGELYAVQFHNLSPTQRLNLMWGLQKSFDLLEEYRKFRAFTQVFVVFAHFWDVIFKGLLCGAAHFVMVGLLLSPATQQWLKGSIVKNSLPTISEPAIDQKHPRSE